MNLGGLSALLPGYVQGQTNLANADITTAKAQDIQDQLAGKAAAGRGLQFLQFMMQQGGGGGPPAGPGAPPAVGANPGFMTPPSPPNGIPAGRFPDSNMARGDQLLGRVMPGPQAAPAGPMGGGGAPPPSPASGGPAGAPMGMPAGGALDWRMVVGAVTRANPGAPPQVIAHAVDQFLPLMNMTSRLEWQNFRTEMMGMIAQQRSLDTQRGQDMRAGTAERGQDIRADTAANAEAGRNARAELSAKTKTDVATLSANTRNEIEAARQEGQNYRVRLSTSARKEIAKLNADSRKEIQEYLEAGRMIRSEQQLTSREKLAESAEAGRTTRANQAEQGRNTRASTAETGRNARAAAAEQGRNARADVRHGEAVKRLDMQERALAERIRANASNEAWRQNKQTATQDLAQWSKLNTDKFRALTAEIQAQSNVLDAKERKRLTDEANAAYIETENEIAGLRKKLQGGGVPAGGASGAPSKPALPKPGDVIDGWKFKGGDPGKRENWEQAA